MASTQNQIVAQPLHGGDYGSFNWIFLIEYILCGILCLWFLFYFNRIFATSILYGARLFTWHKFGVYIDVEALQVSLLAGRIFFKGIRYHGDNETIFIHGGYITWRYWLRKVKKCTLFEKRSQRKRELRHQGRDGKLDPANGASSDKESVGARKDSDLPCRIELRVSGIEAFIYNRSPAYDWIREGCERAGTSTSRAQTEAQFTSHSEKEGYRDLERRKQQDHASPSTTSVSSDSKSGSLRSNIEKQQPQQKPNNANHKPPSPPSILRLLPISVYCNKAAAVLGNENTPSIITAKIDSASGEFDASESGPLDIFKILMQFQVNKPFIQMKPNIDYRRPQLAEAALLEPPPAKGADQVSVTSDQVHKKHATKRDKSKRRWRGFPGLSRRAMQSLESVTKFSRSSMMGDHLPNAPTHGPDQGRWLGLTRYLDDEQRKDEDEWKEVEYAKASTIGDIERVDFKFFWDIAGPVPDRDSVTVEPGPATSSLDINGGDDPPEYGMELFVHGGQVHYGPWADRLRIFLQQLFFPQPFADASPTQRLAPGETRWCTIFKLFLSIETETTLRIPFREPSKDYKWKGRAEATASTKKENVRDRRRGGRRRNNNAAPATHTRSYAWFDVKVKPNSTINYTQDMFPSLPGFNNGLRLDIGGIDIFTSLNHALLWRSGNVKMDADLSNSLKWNGIREWMFDMQINDLELYLLRDHAVLLMDMIEDWTTGPLPDFLTFVPYRYILKPTFNNFRLFLNVNDANIVDRSDDLDDNDFAILYGKDLISELVIPIDRFRPSTNDIAFDVTGHDLGFRLSMPPKNTLNVFLEDKDVAQLPEVELKGTYVLCSEVRPGLVEQLNMEIIGRGLRIAFYGFFARHLAKIKENYFGDDVHFRTLQEYQELLRKDFNSDEPQAPIRSNDLDVILDIIAEDAHIMVPCGLYDCKEYVELYLDSANVDLRVNNYYLELMVDSSPLQLLHGSTVSTNEGLQYMVSSPQLTIDSVNVYGHRLFGLPPSEPAYVSNWDIDAGDIVGECTCEFIAKVASAAQAIALTITDEENGFPIPEATPIYDTTFVRWRSNLIRFWLNLGTEAYLLSTRGISGSFNDLATASAAENLVLHAPEVVVASVGSSVNDMLLKRPLEEMDNTLAYIKTAATIRMVKRAANFGQVRSGQQDHLKANDARTSRAEFLARSPSQPKDDVPATLCLPSLPGPLVYSNDSRQVSDEVAAKNDDMTRRPLNRAYSAVSLDNDKSLLLEYSPRDVNPGAAQGVFQKPELPDGDAVVDFADVPVFPDRTNRASDHGRGLKSDIFNPNTDEGTVHTSVNIQMDQGLLLMCKPRAVLAAARILEALSPQDPSAVFDDYQRETASGVLALLKKRRGDRFILDLGIRLPFLHARIINTAADSSSPSGTANRDMYNIILSNNTTVLRIKSLPDRKHEDDLKAVHLTLSSLEVSVQQPSKTASSDSVALRMSITDVFLWLADSDRTLVNGSYEKMDVRLESKELEFLAALVSRALLLAGSIAQPFLKILAQNAQRRRYIVHYLTVRSDGVPDPAFLTRPAYMIRSAKDHLRNNDSWKIVARLRWVYCCLGAEEKALLAQDCRENRITTPPDDEEHILSILDQWRSWDAVHVRESLAMQFLFGHRTDVEKAHDPGTVPLSINLRGVENRLRLEHGNSCNEAFLNGLSIAVSISPPPPPSAMQLFQDFNEVRLTAVHISSSEAKISLNWELCTLVDDLLCVVENTDFSPFTEGQRTQQTRVSRVPSVTDKSLHPSNEEFHIVFQLDDAEVNLQTINVRQTFASRDFKVSVAGSGWTTESVHNITGVAVSAESASLSTWSASAHLISADLRSPTLAVHFRDPRQPKQSRKSLRIAGNANSLIVDIKQEVESFMLVADQVLCQEAKKINDLARKHSGLGQRKSQIDQQAPAVNTPLRVHVALLLSSYKLRIALLQDLRYSLEGRTLRLSVVPETKSQTAHKVDFDLKAQKHVFTRGDPKQPLAVSTFDLPPINALLRLLVSEDLTTISVAVAMEQIKLDGLALYGLFSMLSTSGILQAIRVLTQDIQQIKGKADEIFPPSANDQAKATQPASGKAMIFDTSVSLAGLLVSAKTRHIMSGANLCALDFVLGSSTFRAANRAPIGDVALPFPEMRAALGKLEVSILRAREGEKGEMVQSANLVFSSSFSCAIREVRKGLYRRDLSLLATGPAIEVDEHTSPAVVELLAHFQQQLRGLDLSKEKQYFRKIRNSSKGKQSQDKTDEGTVGDTATGNAATFVTKFDFNLRNAYALYLSEAGRSQRSSKHVRDIAFSLKRVKIHTKGEKEARLSIEEVKLQMLPHGSPWSQRYVDSAVLPEVIFTASQESKETGRKFSFRAAGQELDIQVHPDIVGPASRLEKSISRSAANTRAAIAKLRTAPALDSSEANTPKVSLGSQSLSALVVDANFAGAVVRLLDKDPNESKSSNFASLSTNYKANIGRYSSLPPDAVPRDAVLRAPGIGLHVQYAEFKAQDPCLNVEIRVQESDNQLTPAVVPLIVRMAHNIKTVLELDSERQREEEPQLQIVKQRQDTNTAVGKNEPSIVQQNPRAILGRTRLVIGMRIARQQFALVCQPIAKVEARMKLEDTYFTIATIDSDDNGSFFTLSMAFTGLQASLKHVYSRDPTFKFDIESIIISMMNSKHISGTNGVSAILKINPMKASLNAKQLQDILLFREIWLPLEIRDASTRNAQQSTQEQQEHFVARYRQIATSASFPWNASVIIAGLEADLDLGQAIGKLSAQVTNLWASSKKTTSAKQELCVGIDGVSLDATGRMSGFVQLNHFRVRTTIAWTGTTSKTNETPLVQGSVGFKELRLKAAFDYQIFAIAHITSFEFIMYNVRDEAGRAGDRLVAILDGGKVHVYCVASTAALAVSLAQAFERLIQERKASYEQSLKEIDSYLRRGSNSARPRTASQATTPPVEAPPKPNKKEGHLPLSLHTDVVVTIGAIDVGAFPRTVMDSQILRLETSDVQARFAVAVEGNQLHSGLGITLGQVGAALATVPNAGVPKALGDIEITEVVKNATSARGGVILRVPKVVAAMQTWQKADSRNIDYKFKSTFEGKIDVGWNYSRISFIRGMWATHSRTLATRLGKPLPQSALSISGPQPLPEHHEERAGDPNMAPSQGQQKITVTANVDLPQSGYTYRALEPAIIDTPQLRDMGEATPPLEWIGLHRDKLPNVTHQVVIVTLLEVAKEVEDTYGRILGSA